MATIERLSTAQVPAPQRLAFWKNVFGNAQSFAVRTRPEDFNGALTRLSAGELELTCVNSTALLTRRVPDSAQNFSLQLVRAGQCRLRHAGADIVAEAGTMLVVDASRPYELEFTRPLQGLVLSLPKARFGADTARLEALAGRPINLDGGPATVLSGFIRSAWDQLVERDGEEWPDSAADVIWDLTTSVLHNDRVAEFTRSRADDLRRRAATLVSVELFNAGFSSSTLAEGLGISTRYLQWIFAEVGITPARFLLAKRLDAVAARLRRTDQPCRITDVALQCGFNDLSHFSRAFRRRFGVSARRYRLGQGGTAPRRAL